MRISVHANTRIQERFACVGKDLLDQFKSEVQSNYKYAGLTRDGFERRRVVLNGNLMEAVYSKETDTVVTVIDPTVINQEGPNFNDMNLLEKVFFLEGKLKKQDQKIYDLYGKIDYLKNELSIKDDGKNVLSYLHSRIMRALS